MKYFIFKSPVIAWPSIHLAVFLSRERPRGCCRSNGNLEFIDLGDLRCNWQRWDLHRILIGPKETRQWHTNEYSTHLYLFQNYYNASSDWYRTKCWRWNAKSNHHIYCFDPDVLRIIPIIDYNWRNKKSKLRLPQLLSTWCSTKEMTKVKQKTDTANENVINPMANSGFIYWDPNDPHNAPEAIWIVPSVLPILICPYSNYQISSQIDCVILYSTDGNKYVS